MFKRINAAVLVMVFVFSMGLTVNAAGGTGDGTGAGGMGTTGNNGVVNGNQGYVTTAADNDMDWGWLGLLGLVGLAGLMGRNRNENPNRG